MRRWYCRLIAVAAVAAVLPGCRPEYPDDIKYEFRPQPEYDKEASPETGGAKRMFGADISAAVKAGVTAELLNHFGTPKQPKVAGLSPEVQNDPELKLDDATLAKGSSLYRRYCLACHGLMGDASGPTAEYILPRPRDFRMGTFKFTSTTGTRPAREDLKRTFRNGIPGSSMPSFNMLKPEELDALASYVIHLSLRGQVEKFAALDMAAGKAADVVGLVQERTQYWLEQGIQTALKPELNVWQQVYAQEVPSGWTKGKQIYLKTCAECHGKDGRASLVEVPTNIHRKNSWGDAQVPRDLTLGQYRGGSRPVDMYFRIRAGITREGMPPSAMNEDETWQVVGYVLSLPQR